MTAQTKPRVCKHRGFFSSVAWVVLLWGCAAVSDKPPATSNVSLLPAPPFLGTACPPPAACVAMLLSPRMVYSLKEYPRMAWAAQQMGLTVLPYRDGRVPDAEWQAAVGAEQLPQLVNAPLWPVGAMDPLASLRMGNHAPTSAVIANGHVHPWPIHGVMPTGAWQDLLAARLRDLQP